MIACRLVILIFMLVFATCCKNEQSEIDCCITGLEPIHNMILNFEDSLGNDLLNANTENHLVPSIFRIYHFSYDSTIDSYFDYGLSNSTESIGQIGINFKGKLEDSINYYFRIKTDDLDTISINWEQAKSINNGNYHFYYNGNKYENIFMEPTLVTKYD